MFKDLIKRLSSRTISEDNTKVTSSLISHVYSQLNVGLIASIFCAGIIFIGLYNVDGANTDLYIWAGIYMTIVLARLSMLQLYRQRRHTHYPTILWKKFYIYGCVLGGLSWGMASVLLLPEAGFAQQTLLIFMLAGVTAGSLSLSAAIPAAGIGFLVAAIAPFIIAILLFKNETYYLFDIALCLYLGYSIVLTLKAYRLIKNSIVLKFENDVLVNDLEMTNKMLEKEATLDPLTQVANRRLFEVNLEKALLRIDKKPHELLALFYIDLDRFKEANDTYGHEVGDIILNTVVERMRNLFQRDDCIARLGGDEFTIIVENLTSIMQIESLAQRICQQIAIPIMHKHDTLQITASIGISMFPEDGRYPETLLKAADQAMYTAKLRGGNSFALYSQPELVT